MTIARTSTHCPGTGWKEAYLGGSPQAEHRIVVQLARQVRRVQLRLKKRSRSIVTRRAFHAKMLAGIANCKFHVDPNLPTFLQAGPFVSGAVYDATVRFSNASGEIKSDHARDLRGIALRISADSRSHDFLMTSAPVSHARDARQFVKVALALASSWRIMIPLRLLFGIGPFQTIRVLANLIRSTRRKPESLATEQFWSRGPMLMNQSAVRFKLRPLSSVSPNEPEKGDDYLRDDFRKRLDLADIHYEFMVQYFVDEARTPLENGAVEWKESDSPFVRIAELVIPRQRLDEAKAIAIENAIDDLEFNPWITTSELRPLGSLNRGRQLVYQSSAHHRAGRVEEIQESLVTRLYRGIAGPSFRLLNRVRPWYKLPTWLALVNLSRIRDELRQHNLHDTTDVDPLPKTDPTIPTMNPACLGRRNFDGTLNDLTSPEMGRDGARFGRNVPLNQVRTDPRLLEPDPRLISRELMTRDFFKPARSLNVLAAAWIQFQVHDWFNHKRFKINDPDQPPIEIAIASDDDWPSRGSGPGDRKMIFTKTCPDPGRLPRDLPSAYANTGTHWWDASQIYGDSPEAAHRMRSHVDGKLNVTDKHLLPIDPETGLEITGFNDNWWLGLSLMHTLFALEHNAVCDRLKRHYSSWSDDALFEKARLVVSALMAKIHTVEWTPGILGHPVLKIAMDTNWWGVLGERITNALGRFGNSEIFSGIIGSPSDHHTAPYALTEEFVSVYRMHPLIPDDYSFYKHQDGQLIGTMHFNDIQGKNTPGLFAQMSMTDLLYSLGIAHPGAITLKNYPRFLQDFTRHPGERFDLAVVDIVRDRERGVPRYNDFRRALRLPPITDFSKLTADPLLAEKMRDIYKEVEHVDTMVGMFAETPPPGFGFSDTAFRIFILMASRRLKSDRFFTRGFNADIYSQVGLEWVRDNGMKSVLLRHFPELGPAVQDLQNIFAPWRRAD